MNQVVISTIGTSLLTQQINRSHSDERDWYERLRDSANWTWNQTPQTVQDIILQLKERAIAKLKEGKVATIREVSAELNGIYGLYEEQIERGKLDMHWLIATDTAQGQETAKIVEWFLREQGLTAQVYCPKGLSMTSTQTFTDGIDDLLTWLESFIGRHDKIYFNLVGGFKSLQAYLNTIGMFYADEIIYIFEGKGSDLIRIPRLPITIDDEAIAPYHVALALMNAGGEVPYTDVAGIQEALVFRVDDDVTLSNWGKLIWNQIKATFLSQDLLQFPGLIYAQSFLKDYEQISNSDERIKLQETLAKVAYLFRKSQGDLAVLRRDGGLQFETYRGTAIEHFRVSLSQRVSALIREGSLELRFYGSHDHVQRSENL